MDISFLLEYINVITLGICLCVGYALKHAKVFDKFGNQYIPLTMLVLGCLINIVTNWPGIDATVLLGGMVSGLASTGLYEMVTNLFEGKTEE